MFGARAGNVNATANAAELSEASGISSGSRSSYAAKFNQGNP